MSRRWIPTVLYLVAAVAIVMGTIWPLWRVLLWFPQYGNEPLQVVAFAGKMAGDIHEIDILNEYIGVKFPHEIPELLLLPKLLYAVAGLAAVAAFLRNRPGLWLKGATIASMVGSGAWMMWRINHYLTNFGANPSKDAPLSGIMKPFKPPLWGKAVIVQVEAHAMFLSGTFYLAAAGVLLALGLWLALRDQRNLGRMFSHE